MNKEAEVQHPMEGTTLEQSIVEVDWVILIFTFKKPKYFDHKMATEDAGCVNIQVAKNIMPQMSAFLEAKILYIYQSPLM